MSVILKNAVQDVVVILLNCKFIIFFYEFSGAHISPDQINKNKAINNTKWCISLPFTFSEEVPSGHKVPK